MCDRCRAHWPGRRRKSWVHSGPGLNFFAGRRIGRVHFSQSKGRFVRRRVLDKCLQETPARLVGSGHSSRMMRNNCSRASGALPAAPSPKTPLAAGQFCHKSSSLARSALFVCKAGARFPSFGSCDAHDGPENRLTTVPPVRRQRFRWFCRARPGHAAIAKKGRRRAPIGCSG